MVTVPPAFPLKNCRCAPSFRFLEMGGAKHSDRRGRGQEKLGKGQTTWGLINGHCVHFPPFWKKWTQWPFISERGTQWHRFEPYMMYLSVDMWILKFEILICWVFVNKWGSGLPEYIEKRYLNILCTVYTSYGFTAKKLNISHVLLIKS